MASSTPTFPAPRRSASVPIQRSSGLDPQTETLYASPYARIVQFQTPGSVAKRASSGGNDSLEEDEVGTLSWVSRFERTIATGPFRIYRAPGSVAFLNCQNALRPILPKSQCWAVDDDSSKFVLQIKRPQYWRIEVPNDTPEDKRRTEELRDVLGNILQFEKTPCPFQRSFVVDLPEQTPTIKRPWKPVERSKDDASQQTSSVVKEQDGAPAFPSQLSTPTIMEEVTDESSDEFTEAPILDGQTTIVAKTQPIVTEAVSEIESRQETQYSKAIPPTLSHATGESKIKDDVDLHESSKSDSISSFQPSILESTVMEDDLSFADVTSLEEDDSYSDATDDTNITPKSRFRPIYDSIILDSDTETETGTENRGLQSLQHYSRSVTAPPVLSLVTSPPSKHRTKSPLRHSAINEPGSDFSSSVESFHSVQSWHSPLAPPSPPSSSPPSPVGQYPYPHNNIVLPKRAAQHNRDVSELTITPDTPRVWDLNPPSRPGSAPRSRSHSPRPTTPALIPSADKSDDEYEILTPPSIRHRATTSSNSRRRELSPLPAAVNLFSPPRRRSRGLQTARHLPTAIVQKTCEILLSPPSHLLHLMLKIASKIAAGEWRGVLSGQGESVHWDFEDEYGDGTWEDDFGISLPAAKNGTPKGKKNSSDGGSWEVD